MRNNKSGEGGIGFFGLLTIVLIVLKITGVISINPKIRGINFPKVFTERSRR